MRELDGQYLTIDDLSSYIHRSKGAIRNLVLRRAIPYRKPAGRLIFLKEEIDKWIQSSPGKTFEELENDQWDRESLKSIHGKPARNLNSSIKYN